MTALWGFAIHRGGDELALLWDAPPDAADLVTSLLAYLQGDQPITAISGLL